MLAGLAVIVELVARLGIVRETTLSPVSEVALRSGQLLLTPAFYADAVVPSLLAIGGAFILASVVGIVLGYVIWRFWPLRQALDPYLTAYYAIPTFALYPILIVLWGAGRWPIIMLAAIFSVVAVIMNAMNGYDSVPPIVGKLAKSLNVNESTYFLKFFLPYAIPYILVGLRLAFLYSLLSVLAAEFLLSSSGLGFFIQNAYTRFSVLDMYAGILIILVLAIAAERLITCLVHKLTWVGGLS